MKCTVTVKNPSITLNQTEAALAIGETVKLTATAKPSSATVSYASDKADVAEVAADGTVTAKGAGEATITATAKCGTVTKTATAKVTVKKTILKEVKQTKAKELELTVAGDTKDLKVPDFKITNTATNATAAIESVKEKKNFPNILVVTTYTAMDDAKEYTVEFAGTKVTFTATDGAVAKVDLSKTEVSAGKLVEVKLRTLDKNGVILTDDTKLTSTDTGKGKVSSEIKQSKGYTQDSSIFLPAVGDTAEVKVIYHSGSYGTDGKETGNIEDTFTIKAVDPTLENLNFDVTISDGIPAWKAASFKKNDKLAIGAAKDAYIRITNEDGTDIAASDYANYKVESADRSKVLVQDMTLAGAGVGSTAVPVNGVSEGTAYILVKNQDDKTVASLPITVQGKPVATTLDLDRPSVTVVDGATVPENIKLTLKDQYSSNLNIGSIDVELVSKPKTTSNDPSAAIKGTFTNGSITVKGTDFTVDDGAYIFKITATDADNDKKSVSRTLTVTRVRDSGTVDSYVVKADNAEVDTTIGKGAVSIPNIKLSIAEITNGGVSGFYSATHVEYTVKNAKGDVIAKVDNTGAMVTTCSAIDNSAYDYTANTKADLIVKPVTSPNANYYHKNLAAGTYTVTAVFNVGSPAKKTTAYGSFTIKDTQEGAASCTITDNKFTGQTVADAFEDGIKVDVYFDGVKQAFTSGDVISVDGTVLTNGGAFVRSVELYVTVSGSTNKFNITVPVQSSQGTVAECTGLK